VRQRRWGHGSRVRGSEEEGGDGGGAVTGRRSAAAGEREARGGGGGQGGARIGRAFGVLGVYLYITPGCIQYREYTWVHFSAVVCVYIYIYMCVCVCVGARKYNNVVLHRHDVF
jgi:hypothetical protein